MSISCRVGCLMLVLSAIITGCTTPVENRPETKIVKEKISIHNKLAELFDTVNEPEDFKLIGPEANANIDALKKLDEAFNALPEDKKAAALAAHAVELESAKRKDVDAKRKAANRALKDKLKGKDGPPEKTK